VRDQVSHESLRTASVQGLQKTVDLTVDPFILHGLSFVDAQSVWATLHSRTASQSGVWVRCVTSVET
jgi:hypothetical protein